MSDNLTRKKTVGQPRKWDTPQELIPLIEEYLNETEFDKYSLTGLCIHLGTNKQTLANYQKREGFTEIIEEAKLYIEHSYEMDCKKYGRTGSIFALKNFGWTDRQEIDYKDKTDYTEHQRKIDAYRKQYESAK